MLPRRKSSNGSADCLAVGNYYNNNNKNSSKRTPIKLKSRSSALSAGGGGGGGLQGTGGYGLGGSFSDDDDMGTSTAEVSPARENRLCTDDIAIIYDMSSTINYVPIDSLASDGEAAVAGAAPMTGVRQGGGSRLAPACVQAGGLFYVSCPSDSIAPHDIGSGSEQAEILPTATKAPSTRPQVSEVVAVPQAGGLWVGERESYLQIPGTSDQNLLILNLCCF